MTTAELNFAWAATIADVLIRRGVKHIALSPGSRSAPLALAFAERRELTVWPIPDERSAGFFALGVGMSTGTPAALVVTSGTAGANAYPAVIEASLSSVPLVVVTANRPPELHGFGALQTIEQHRLFGSYAEFVPLGVPEAGTAKHLRATVARALSTATVVHLDVPFREPLALAPGARLPAAFEGHERFEAAHPGAAQADVRVPARTVIVAGPARFTPAQRDAIAGLAERLQAPILAEASSGFRYGAHASHAVAHYDALLRVEALRSELKPDLVIRVGGPLTTRTMQAFVDAHTVVAIAEPGRVCDPNHSASVVLEGDPGLTAAKLQATSPDPKWLARWQELDARAAAALEQLSGEPAFARELVAALPAGANLMLSNSMPIREVDAFASRSARALEVFASRGASGIDGITSTAFGIAAATGRKTALLVGDTALLHDVGGLVWGSRLKIPLCVVALNNAGGRIFELLPVAQSTPRLGELFVMPPQVELRHAAALAGATHHDVRDAGHLGSAVRQALEGGVHLVEVDARGRDLAEDHRRAWAAVAGAVQ